jgi:hypothetical protein
LVLAGVNANKLMGDQKLTTDPKQPIYYVDRPLGAKSPYYGTAETINNQLTATGGARFSDAQFYADHPGYAAEFIGAQPKGVYTSIYHYDDLVLINGAVVAQFGWTSTRKIDTAANGQTPPATLDYTGLTKVPAAAATQGDAGALAAFLKR